MKIASICRYFYPFEGGVETFNLQLMKSLSKKNQVHVFTANFPKNKANEKIFELDVHRFNFLKFINEPLFWFYSTLKKINPDVVHVQYPAPWCHFWSLVYCALHKKKMIVTYHAKPISSVFARIGGWLYDTLIFYPFSKVCKKIVYTYSTLGPKLKNSTVIPTGIDEKRFTQPHLTKEFDLLYVGRIVDYKRIEWLLQAAKKLNLRVAIAGSGPYLRTLENMAYKLKADAIFFGKVKNEIVHNLFQKSRVFVLPSKSEGMPLTPLEALASGTPVLASRVGGLPDVLDERFLFNDYQEFITKLRKIIANPIQVHLDPKYFVDNVNKAYEKVYSESR